MEVVVIGSSGTFPRAGGACNGYLVRGADTVVLLDMGPSVLSRLYEQVEPGALDALILTHMHPDHFIDIYPFRYYLEFCAADNLPLKVLAPPRAAEFIKPLFNESAPAGFGRIFDFVDLSEDRVYEIGEFEITAWETKHLKPTFGISVKAGSKRMFYTSDASLDDHLATGASGVDLLLAEATLTAAVRKTTHVAHMSTLEAAELARRAGSPKLMLTHLWPHFDREVIRREVEDVFSGQVYLADEGLTVTV